MAVFTQPPHLSPSKFIKMTIFFPTGAERERERERETDRQTDRQTDRRVRERVS